MVGADRPGTDEGQSANQQRPDEQLTVLQFIRGRRRRSWRWWPPVRDRREPAHFHHPHIFTAAADNRRQPQYKAVYADTPGKILRAEQDHVAGAEGFAIVTHRFDALLFTIQLFLQRRFSLSASRDTCDGLSFTSTHQQKAQITAGTPSMMNISASRRPESGSRRLPTSTGPSPGYRGSGRCWRESALIW